MRPNEPVSRVVNGQWPPSMVTANFVKGLSTVQLIKDFEKL